MTMVPNRFMQPSTESSKEAGGKALDYLGRPLNAVQGAMAYGVPAKEGFLTGLSGEKKYDGLDAFSPEFTAENPEIASALAVGSDIFLDPVNAVGGGLLTAGKNMVKGARSLKGLGPSSFKNYIDDYYGLSQQEWEAMSEGQKKAWAGLSKLTAGKLGDDKETAAAFRKGWGMLKFFMDGMTDWAGNALSPKSRALYREAGIPQSTIDYIDNQLKLAVENGTLNRKSPAFKKAIAQAQYQMLVLARMGDEKTLTDVLDRVGDVSFTGQFLPFNKEAYSQTIRSSGNARFADTGRKVGVNDKVNNKAVDLIARAWDMEVGDPNVSLWVKRPTGAGGDHVTDAGRKNTARAKMEKVFDKNYDENFEESFTPEGLFEVTYNQFYLKNGKPKAFAEGHTLLTESAEQAAEEGGVWLGTSGRSVSYTEGGINQLIHVTPEGKVTAFISDEQNFLEKVPGIGQAMEGVEYKGKKVGGELPIRQLTISEPIYFDISPNRTNRKVTHSAPKGKEDQSRLYKEDLEKITSLKPSAKARTAETMQVAGEGMLLGNVGTYDPED